MLSFWKILVFLIVELYCRLSDGMMRKVCSRNNIRLSEDVVDERNVVDEQNNVTGAT